MIEQVTTEWIEENVLESQSDPTLVYVTGDLDQMRHIHLPLLEEIVAEVPKLTVVELDYHEDFAETMQVCYVPTVLIFKKGDLVQTMSGVLPAELLLELATEAAKSTMVDDLIEAINSQKDQQ